ncbi:YhhN family protein [Entamoeba marina]
MFSSLVLLSVLVDAVLCWVSYVKKITTMKVITKPSFSGLILASYILLPVGSLTSVSLMQNSKSKTQKYFTLAVHVYSSCLLSGGFFAYLTLGSESGILLVFGLIVNQKQDEIMSILV